MARYFVAIDLLRKLVFALEEGYTFDEGDPDVNVDMHYLFKNFVYGQCCDMGQNDTISKIELNPSFILSSDNTNYKNDIQLFPQLFDELRVNGDYH